jgi:2-oxoglutarate ferredoxin oxidoreductase subunit beta
VYGLTKGQFSATADRGQTLKGAGTNPFTPVDIALTALSASCSFVARSFAGDPKQVTELIKAALSFAGTAVLDIISPCVTFNNRDESTKSYAWGKEHEDPLHDVTFVPTLEEIQVDYAEGEATSVRLHDGSTLVLKKLDVDYDPTDRAAAFELLERTRREQVLPTGLIYVSPEQATLQSAEQLIDEPLVGLPEQVLRPSRASLEQMMAEFK